MRINKFEDLDCWKEGRKLSKMIYGLTKAEPFSKDYGLRNQIQRASVSVMSNIAEGLNSRSDKEFINFLSYSRRSCSEIQSCLYVAQDQHYITENQFNKSYKQVKKTAKQINGFIKYLREG